MIKCSDIAEYLEMIAPARLAEDYDNVGLILGSRAKEVGKVLCCLDISPETADYAVSNSFDMIVSHHPLIFKGLKRIDPDTPKGRTLYKLISSGICVFAAHTNFDASENGLSGILANKLELVNITQLNKYKEDKLHKLVVYVPADSLEKVREAICTAGAGWIGNYSDCTFRAFGKGTFKPLDGTNPYIGEKGKLEEVDEYRLETVVPSSQLSKVVSSMLKAHPYEEVAYDVFNLENNSVEYSLGSAGLLKQESKLSDFAVYVKEKLGADAVRLIGKDTAKPVKRVAVFCGSFDGDWSGYKRFGADVLVTGDIKYHEAQEAAEMGFSIVDAGHFATENIFAAHMARQLADKFHGLVTEAPQLESDPFKYY